MKTLKFRETLSKLILAGEKDTTWRLFDDKNLMAGDAVSLITWETKQEFARAKIISIRETTLGELSAEDWEGHERFSSEEEMYTTYSRYYNRLVTKDTLVKVIRFELQ